MIYLNERFMFRPTVLKELITTLRFKLSVRDIFQAAFLTEMLVSAALTGLRLPCLTRSLISLLMRVRWKSRCVTEQCRQASLVRVTSSKSERPMRRFMLTTLSCKNLHLPSRKLSSSLRDSRASTLARAQREETMRT